MNEPRRLHHLALGARDVARMASFYREVLGLAELRRHRDERGALRAIWLALGGGARLMIERSDAPRAPRESGVVAGLFLLAVEVSADERAACEQRLLAAGASIEARTAFTSYARDPEGHRVAISHYPHPPRR